MWKSATTKKEYMGEMKHYLDNALISLSVLYESLAPGRLLS